MNIFQVILGRQLALNQGVTQQQAMLDGLTTGIMRQPMGLVVSLFLAKNQANADAASSAVPAGTIAPTLTLTGTTDATGVITYVASVVRPAGSAMPVPTGVVTIINIVTGAQGWTVQLPLDSSGNTVATPSVTGAGMNTIAATYSGDAVYQSATTQTTFLVGSGAPALGTAISKKSVTRTDS